MLEKESMEVYAALLDVGTGFLLIGVEIQARTIYI